MSSDRSRGYDDPRQSYKAVVLQQGRVILDRDFNTLQEIADQRSSDDARAEIGPCGSPDNGFGIFPIEESCRGAEATDHLNFQISPGVMYVGGQRFELAHPATYQKQPYWLWPPGAISTKSGGTAAHTNEFVYLLGFEREVSAVEDPDLLDVALGGPDTTQRIRLMWRVHTKPVKAENCHSSIEQMSVCSSSKSAPTWHDEGYRFHAETMRLLPQVQLKASFTSPPTSNPCGPTTQGSYQYPENQLIRVQIGPEDACGKPTLLWGYNNASFLYRVSLQDSQNLNLNTIPVDAFHCPKANQIVEVLLATSELGTIPGSPPLVRFVAAATGYVAEVAGYSPITNTVTLTNPLPSEYTGSLKTPNDPKYQLFLRIWQGQQSFDLGTQISLTDPTSDSVSPGVNVTITVPKGRTPGALPLGEFWMLALRPSTPQVIYPERFLSSPQWPDGPRQWVCPLAILNREGRPIADCRHRFLDLVTLTKREWGGGCRLEFQPGDEYRVQMELDRCAALGQPVTAHFAPGSYSFPKPLRLDSRHSRLTLEASGGAATFRALDCEHTKEFHGGLIVMAGADEVTIRGLHFVPTPVSTGMATISHLEALIAIRSVNCRRLRLENCRIAFQKHKTIPGGILFASGLFLAGDCTGLHVQNCHFTSDYKLTSTLQDVSPNLERLAAGHDKLYFSVSSTPAAIGTIDPLTQEIALYPLPTPDSQPRDLFVTWDKDEKHDHVIWIVEQQPYRLTTFNPKNQEFKELELSQFHDNKYTAPRFKVGHDKKLYMIVGSSILMIEPNHPSEPTTYKLETGNLALADFALSSDGNIFACDAKGKVYLIDRSDHHNPKTSELEGMSDLQVTEFLVGRDGNIWFLSPGNSKAGKINPKNTKTVTSYPIQSRSPGGSGAEAGHPVLPAAPTLSEVPGGEKLAAPAGAVVANYLGLTQLSSKSICFLQPTANTVWLLNTSTGEFQQKALPPINPIKKEATTAESNPIPTEIVTGADNIAWILNPLAKQLVMFNHINDRVYSFPLSGAAKDALSLTTGPGHNIWLLEPSANSIVFMNALNQSSATLKVSLSNLPLTAATGILAIPAVRSLVSDVPHVPVLAQATLVGNTFDNLTLPFAAEAELGSISIRDNSITSSLSGILLRASSYIAGGDLAAATSAFREMQVSTHQLGMYFDLPTGVRTSHASADRLSILIANNRIEAVPRHGGEYGSSGLIVWLDESKRHEGTVIISSNDIRNRPPLTKDEEDTASSLPTVIIDAANTALTITGNVIANVTWLTHQTNSKNRSIWIDPHAPPKLAATGNVLRGVNNLNSFPTDNTGTGTDWSFFNLIK